MVKSKSVGEIIQEVYFYCEKCGASLEKQIGTFEECPCPDCQGHYNTSCGECGTENPAYLEAYAWRIPKE
ncbi:MAG: hypothetical protein ACTSV7_03040 [Candidatus Baldrarchaeia archaeon]